MSVKTLTRLAPSVLLLSGLAAMHPAAAQFVTFGSAQTISGVSDVSTAGTSVAAYDFNNSGPTTVNGVTFNPTSNTGSGNLSISGAGAQYGGFGSGSPAFSSLDSSYQSLLTNGAYADSGTVGFTQGNLTAGERYQVQYFVDDSRGGFGGRTVDVSSSGGNTQNLKFASDNNAGSLGQYANGTFTAASGNVTITALGKGGSPSQINGLQFRDLGNAGAPVTFTTAAITTADATLGLAGTVITAADFGAGTQIVSYGNNQTITFDGASASATVVGGNNTTIGAFNGDTGNTNFNSVLNGFNYDSAAGSKQITLSGLTAGQQYSLQLFGLDDRGGNESSRQISFSDFSGGSSGPITSGSNTYVLGTFTALSSFETITESVPNGGNINALVLRSLSAAPEPSQIASLALAALGMLGVILKARKRKASMELN